MVAASRFAPGTLIGERFVVEQLAGSGGMGEVYRTKDLQTGRSAAVKVLHTDSAHSARFAREVRALAQLDHPGIVRYVAHGDQPLVFLAMEWLDGEDLWQRLGRGKLSVRDVVTLAQRLAEALSVAHVRGIVHRDIKPSNIFLPGRRIESVKLLDFGIALFSQSTRAVTISGQVLGTLGYMAPEQASEGREVTSRVDVFSLGCVLFECLTGRPAFPGDRMMEVLSKILFAETPRVSDLCEGVPDPLSDIVAKMMRKDPDTRPSLAAVAAELEALSAMGGLTTAPSTPRPVIHAAGPAVGADERRLMGVVLADHVVEGGAVSSSSPTLAIDKVRDVAISLGEAIAPLGGRLEILPNGATLVVLTATEAATDLATRAARCALAVRATLPGARTAIAVGRGDPSAEELLGELVGRADALLKLANEGPEANGQSQVLIRIDAMTAGLLDTRFELSNDPQGLALVGERDRPEPVRKLMGKPTPCVGREREIATLNAIADECFTEPIASAVVVTAPAGIGKTRLAHEFLRGLEARYPRLELWTARGDPMSAGSPFALLTQMLQAISGITGGESADSRRQKLRARLERRLAERDVPRVMEAFAELLHARGEDEPAVSIRGARQDGALVAQQVSRAWDDLLEVETASHPVVFLLEDMHWGDRPSVRLIDATLRALRDRPLLVIALGRPELAEVFPSLWSDRRVTEIRLAELTPSAARRLILDVLGDKTPRATADRLVERAGGNAFYLEELIRSVVEGADNLPDTVLAMAQARLERLDAESRRILRAASLFGPSFWAAGVAALLGLEGTGADLSGTLAQLEKRELVTRSPSSRFADEDEYAFRQLLVRDAAYNMLPARDKRSGHRLAAEWLEARGERDAMVLAEHFDRGGEPHRAIVWYLWAAEQAFETNDLPKVVERAQKGIACGASGAVLGELRLLQAEGVGWGGGGPDHARYARAALALLPRGSTAWCRAAAELSVASCRAGDVALLRSTAQDLASIEIESPVAVGHALAMGRTMTECLVVGADDAAADLLGWVTKASAYAHEEDVASFAVVKTWLEAAQALYSSNPEPFLREAAAITAGFERDGHLRHNVIVAMQTSMACAAVGRWGEGIDWARRAADIAGRMSLRAYAERVECHLGNHLAELGRAEEAEAAARAALARGTELCDVVTEGAARALIARLCFARDDLEAADAEARAVMDGAHFTTEARGRAAEILAKVLLRTGRPVEAVALASTAVALLDTGSPSGDGSARLLLVEALLSIGDSDGANSVLAAARRQIEERAGALKDPTVRADYLALSHHATTLALCEKRGIDASDKGAIA